MFSGREETNPQNFPSSTKPAKWLVNMLLAYSDFQTWAMFEHESLKNFKDRSKKCSLASLTIKLNVITDCNFLYKNKCCKNYNKTAQSTMTVEWK